MTVRDVEVVNAGEDEQSSGDGLRNPPGAAKGRVFTVLHVARGEVEADRDELNSDVHGGRTREWVHERVALHAAVRDGLASGVGVESGGAVLRNGE